MGFLDTVKRFFRGETKPSPASTRATEESAPEPTDAPPVSGATPLTSAPAEPAKPPVEPASVSAQTPEYAPDETGESTEPPEASGAPETSGASGAPETSAASFEEHASVETSAEQEDPGQSAEESGSEGVPDAGAPPASPGKFFSAEESAYYFVPDENGDIPVRIRDGAFFHAGTGKYAQPGNRALADQGLESFVVRDTAEHAAAVRDADTTPGTSAILRPDPDDSSAVTVSAQTPGGDELLLGHTTKSLGKQMLKTFEAGEDVPAYFLRGDAPGSDESGVAVVLTDARTIAQLLS